MQGSLTGIGVGPAAPAVRGGMADADEMANGNVRALLEAVAWRTGGDLSVQVSGREPYLSLRLRGVEVSVFAHDEETVVVSVPYGLSARVTAEEWAVVAVVRQIVLEPPPPSEEA